MKATEEQYLDLNVVNIHDKDEKILTYNGQIEKQLIQEAKKGFPYEIAGFLIGKIGDQDSVTGIYPVENIAKHQERRFEIDSLDYIKAETYALARDLDVIGIYHSHPDYPAIPSKHDLKFAHEVFSYVIVSIDAAGSSLINSWKKEHDKFIQQNIQLKK